MLMRKIFAIVGILVLLLNIVIAAQAAQSLTLLDDEGKPIAWTVVVLNDGTTEWVGITGDDGTVEIAGFQEGKYQLTVPLETYSAEIVLEPEVVVRIPRQNLFRNPSLEVKGNAGRPMNWGSDTPAMVTYDETVSHWGSASALISVPDDFSGKWWNNNIVQEYQGPCVGVTFKATAWVKTEGLWGGQGVHFVLDCKNALGNEMYARAFSGYVAGTSDWQLIEATVYAPEGTEKIRFAVQVDGKGKVWIDDLSLVKVE